MARAAIFEWHAKEYSFEQKNADWYWALGIIALAIAVACVLFNNILLALVTVAAAAAVALQAAKHPRIHRFVIAEDGVQIDDRLYPFSSMIDFSVLEYLDESLPPALSIKTKHMLSPHILVPLVDVDVLDVYDYVSQHLPEGKHEGSLFDRLANLLQL